MDVTPGPVLAWFQRANHGMLGLVEMLCGVAPWRGIATANMPADPTLPQMHPVRPLLQAVLAGVGRLGRRKILFSQIL